MTGGTAHFQLFALDGKTNIRWRLLSANNRELGRSYSTHPTTDECFAAIISMVAALDGLVVTTRRRDQSLWEWLLFDADRPIAMSGRGHDRQIRSIEAAARFRCYASLAPVSDALAHTGARRWVRASLRRTD